MLQVKKLLSHISIVDCFKIKSSFWLRPDAVNRQKGVFHFFNKEKFKSFWQSVYLKYSALHKVVKQRKSGGIIKLSCLVRRKFYCVVLFISFLYFTFISPSHQPPVGNNKPESVKVFVALPNWGLGSSLVASYFYYNSISLFLLCTIFL